jgi:8-oxo-dGTP pyrophosphatase MutT (NUDIX family)
MASGTSSGPDSAYLLLYRTNPSTGKIQYYTINNYAGIRVNDNGRMVERMVKCFDTSTNSVKSSEKIIAEIRQNIQVIKTKYHDTSFNYLHPKITNEKAAPEKSSFYFVSPENPSGTNFINLPGGQKDSSDNDLRITVIREVLEELQIDISHIVTSTTPTNLTNNGKKQLFLVNYDRLSDIDKNLFVDKDIPGIVKTFCGISNIETNEGYLASWKYYSELDNIATKKFQEGMAAIGDTSAATVAKPYKPYRGYHPGGNQDIYYMKYLKYKAKYLKLKESIKI